MPRREDGSAPVSLTQDALSVWTHDLRNPLAALVANLHHVRETLTEAGDEDAHEVLSECLALLGQLDRYAANLEILGQGDAALAERGRPVDLFELSNEVTSRLGAYANVTGHRFRVLVQGEEDPKVECDRQILRRLLENLVSNALENAPAGPVDIVVSARRDPTRAGAGPRDEGIITIVDRGPPWPTEPTPTVVEARTTRRPGGLRYGRGLGVEAAKLAAHVIGARIELGRNERGETSATVSAPLYTPGDSA